MDAKHRLENTMNGLAAGVNRMLNGKGSTWKCRQVFVSLDEAFGGQLIWHVELIRTNEVGQAWEFRTLTHKAPCLDQEPNYDILRAQLAMVT